MKKGKFIIIAGCGKMGASLIEAFSDTQNDITVIDRDECSFKKLPHSIGNITINGDVNDIETLIRADIQSAGIVIAATNDDNTNFFVAQVAKEIYKVPKVISLLRDASHEGLYRQYGIQTICPASLSVAAMKEEVE